MSRTNGRTPALWITTAAFVGASLAAGCGGPDFPKHDGYPDAKSMPWKHPRQVKLDDRNEAEVEGKLSYPRRHRVRWYQVNLPRSGELVVKMEVIPLGTRESVNLGFEVLDKNYRVLMRLDPTEDAAARAEASAAVQDDDWDDDDDDGFAVPEETAVELEWERTLYELTKDTYYLHLYLNGRTDETEFAMRLKFVPKALERESTFPADVAFPDPLPIVPMFDDTPELDCKTCDCKSDARCKAECSSCKRRGGQRPSYCSRCDCQGPCKDRCRSKCGGDEPASTASSVKARILRPVASSGGTRITLNRGSSHGVEAGWKGQVVNKAGKAIEGGGFTVSRVKANECEGQVGAPPDAVIAAGYAVLRAP